MMNLWVTEDVCSLIVEEMKHTLRKESKEGLVLEIIYNTPEFVMNLFT